MTAGVVKLVDARDSKSRGPCAHESSSLSAGTIISVNDKLTKLKCHMKFKVQMTKRINHSLAGAAFSREIPKLKGEILAFEF